MNEGSLGPALEHLETRALFSPTLLNLAAAPNPAIAGGVTVATLDASPAATLRAASFFRDVNGNGGWDVGIDQALGDSFTQVAPGRFQKVIQVGLNWPASTRIVANAVDTSGAWGTPRGVTLSVNNGPIVTGVSVNPNPTEPGGTALVTVEATFLRPLRAATYFRDVNRNMIWDPGIDQTLGDSFVPTSPGHFQKTVQIGANWNPTEQIVVNVLDVDGVWGAPKARIITVGSPPEVASVTVTPGFANVGTPVVVAVMANSSRQLRAATFFRDVNGNGKWDADTDRTLGDSFSQVAPGRFQRTVIVGNDWDANTTIVANVVDSVGQWGVAQSQSLTVNHAPEVTNALLSTLHPEVGDIMRAYAAGWDDNGVHAMTAFIDVDRNSRWTPGVDRWLADDFTPDSRTGVFEFSFMVKANWPSFSDVRIEAVDAHGFYSGDPYLAGTVRVNASPLVESIRYAVGDASPAEPTNPLILTATATDDTLVAAVRFWIDLDGDGAWSPQLDQMLGESRTKTPGTSDFTLRTYTELAGLDTAVIGADAMDLDGRWSSIPRTVQATLPRLPHVMQFFVDTSDAGYALTADAWFPPSGQQAAARVARIQFVADANFNGVRDASDVLVAVVASGQAQASGWRHFYRLTSNDIARLPASYQWLAIPVFTGPNSADVLGAGRTGLARAITGGEPVVTSLTVSVGVDFFGNQASPTPGNYFRAEADAEASSGVQGITFYWDRNLNGRWEGGVDMDLGYIALGGGASEHAVLSGLITEAMAGKGAIVAAARTSTGSGLVWSASRSEKIDRVLSGPRLEVVDASVTAGQFIVELDARDDFGTSGITGWLDADHDGLDADDVSFSFVRYSGSGRAGGWRLVINAAGLDPGTRLYIQAADFYRGDNSTGMLSRLISVEIPNPW